MFVRFGESGGRIWSAFQRCVRDYGSLPRRAGASHETTWVRPQGDPQTGRYRIMVSAGPRQCRFRASQPNFPYTSYAGISTQDMKNLYACLRTLPPGAGRPQRHDLQPLSRCRRFIGVWKLPFAKAMGGVGCHISRLQYIAGEAAFATEWGLSWSCRRR